MVEKDLETANFFIELDVLFDTRLAVILKHTDKKPTKDFGKEYRNRISDIFPFLTNFKELYDNRDKSILEYAFISRFILVLQEYSKRILDNANKSPYQFKPTLIVNTYPYKLSDDEISVLIKGLIVKTGGYCDIQAVNMSYEEITPKYVKENLGALSLYDFDKWIELHSVNKNFEETTCPEVMMFGPKINKKDSSIPKEDDFRAYELIASPLIGINLLPIEYFCVHN